MRITIKIGHMGLHKPADIAGVKIASKPNVLRQQINKMADFDNRKDYEAWKAKKVASQNEKDTSIDITPDDVSDNSISPKAHYTTKNQMILYLVATIIFVAIAMGAYYYWSTVYQPKSVVAKYLKSVQLHDYDTLKGLEFGAKNFVIDGVLINLIDWKIVGSKSFSTTKVMVDVSEGYFNSQLKTFLDVYHVNSTSEFPYEKMKKEFSSYDAWRSSKTAGLQEENGTYYFISDKPEVEYLIDITAANALGIELKKKYLLRVRYEGYSNGWKVIMFDERA